MFEKHDFQTKKCASGHILYAQLRTLGGLFKYLLGVPVSYFYFIAHTACYCMSTIRLSGSVWINCLYASISVSCESLIGYTADLGRMLIDARVITCSTHVLQRYLMYGLFRPVVTMPSIGRWLG
jgi:hypothetical protein